jgi:protein-S-isoprenylcysteine O-methyltransferase Ste14
MFTFDLTVHPKHRLVTERFYSFVRHPAYTGSLMLVFGLALSHLTRGSWLSECAFPLLDAPFPFPLLSSSASPTSLATRSYVPLLGLSSHKIRLVVWALWWAWTLCVGVSRAEAEDRQMRKLFGAEWEGYRRRVAWWFMPGVL